MAPPERKDRPVARIYPVADGVLKHQLYIEPNYVPSGTSKTDAAVVTFWTWKLGGSPVGAGRITDEQTAILAWLTSHARDILTQSAKFTWLRTWDYGLDPATRTSTRVWPNIPGTLFTAAGGQMPDTFSVSGAGRVVALRTQAVGSATRNRINGRLNWPLAGYSGGPSDFVPTSNNVTTAFGVLLAALNGGGTVGKWSVVSYRNASAIRAVPLVTGINHVVVQRIGYQRRRPFKPGPYARGA